MDDFPIKSLLISMRTKYPHAFFLSRCRFTSGSFEALWLPAHFEAVVHGDFAAPVQLDPVVFEGL
jgi:hypothetical protein